jgi:hypothetical protein
MADQAPEFDGRARADLPPGIFGMMAVPVTATVIAILYFAREVFVPITLAVLFELSAGASRAMAPPVAGGPDYAVAFTVMVAFMAIAGFAAVVVGEVSSIPIQPANQNPFASRNGARRRCFPSRDRDVP